MKYKLRVSLGEGVILERTVEADNAVMERSAEGSFQSIDLNHGRLTIAALRYAVPRGQGLPETEFDCLVTLEEDPE